MLRDWICRHFEATGSPRAKWILENWDAMLPKFVKVFPHEFKRVLAQESRRRRPCGHAAQRMRGASEPQQVLHG